MERVLGHRRVRRTARSAMLGGTRDITERRSR
jgi:hypothetical protein